MVSQWDEMFRFFSVSGTNEWGLDIEGFIRDDVLCFYGNLLTWPKHFCWVSLLLSSASVCVFSPGPPTVLGSVRDRTQECQCPSGLFSCWMLKNKCNHNKMTCTVMMLWSDLTQQRKPVYYHLYNIISILIFRL